MKVNKSELRLALGTALVVAICAGIIWSGLRVNTSESMPLGLWRITPTPQRLERGMIVAVCMPDTPITQLALRRHYFSVGWCPSHTEILPKPIAAVAGDVVVVAPEGITINGATIPNTAQVVRDLKGRELPKMPAGEYNVQEDKIWLLATTNPLSFDSRYYGPIDIRDIQGIAIPLLVW